GVHHLALVLLKARRGHGEVAAVEFVEQFAAWRRSGGTVAFGPSVGMQHAGGQQAEKEGGDLHGGGWCQWVVTKLMHVVIAMITARDFLRRRARAGKRVKRARVKGGEDEGRPSGGFRQEVLGPRGGIDVVGSAVEALAGAPQAAVLHGPWSPAGSPLPS